MTTDKIAFVRVFLENTRERLGNNVFVIDEVKAEDRNGEEVAENWGFPDGHHYFTEDALKDSIAQRLKVSISIIEIQ